MTRAWIAALALACSSPTGVPRDGGLVCPGVHPRYTDPRYCSESCCDAEARIVALAEAARHDCASNDDCAPAINWASVDDCLLVVRRDDPSLAEMRRLSDVLVKSCTGDVACFPQVECNDVRAGCAAGRCAVVLPDGGM